MRYEYESLNFREPDYMNKQKAMIERRKKDEWRLIENIGGMDGVARFTFEKDFRPYWRLA